MWLFNISVASSFTSPTTRFTINVLMRLFFFVVVIFRFYFQITTDCLIVVYVCLYTHNTVYSLWRHNERKRVCWWKKKKIFQIHLDYGSECWTDVVEHAKTGPLGCRKKEFLHSFLILLILRLVYTTWL